MHWQYVIPGYAVAIVALSAYAIVVLRRGRTLARRLPEDRRRFLD